MGEIVIIAVLALLLLGPDRLPDAAKTLGKGLRELRRATDDIKGQVERELYVDGTKPARPTLVPPVPAQPVPGPAGPPPAATVENVPGLDAALAEAPAVPAPRPGPTVTAPIPTVAAPMPTVTAPAEPDPTT